MHVLVIPHGFQEHYSLGFANGLAANGISVDFVSAANMNTALLHRDVRSTDLGCNTERRIGVLKKAYRFIAYHLKLIGYVAKRHGAVVHVIGGIRRPIAMTGIIEGLLFRSVARRYVVTIHNILPHDQHTVWNKRLFKIVYRIPQLLVVHTHKMKQELVQAFGVRRPGPWADACGL